AGSLPQGNALQNVGASLLAKESEHSPPIVDRQKETRCNANRTGFFVASQQRMSWIRRQP
ncbi:hypothetical protein, partial [Pseudomonas sp. PS02286]|uniref:hypothetical protein n=1 Tax=Pseudomonas sp. PS02286 TaxID=2991442 RepID=UPI00249AB664